MEGSASVDNSQVVVIPFNRKVLAGMAAGSIAFVVLAAFLWTIADEVQRSSPVVVRVGSIAGIVFFGAVLLSILPKLLNPKPGLVLDDSGIIDNSSGISAGLIEWADIQKVEQLSIRGQLFLMVFVTDPAKYIARAGPLKRFMMKLNESWYGSPLSISTQALQTSFKELEELINSRLATQGRVNHPSPQERDP